LKHGERSSFGRAMFLVIVLAVFAFSITTTTTRAATISVPRIDRLNQTSSVKYVQPLGDPIDGGPPGAWRITKGGN
jgi:hypothetical protein